MTLKMKIASTLIVLSFIAGRYSAPLSVKTEKETTKSKIAEKIQETKEQVNTNRNKHISKIVTERVLPNGVKEKTTRVTLDDVDKTIKTDNNDKVSEAAENTSTKESKTVEKNSSKINISLLGATLITDPTKISYGLSISKEIVGPITLGVFGFNSGNLGASLGINF